MTELDFYKWLEEWRPEWHWDINMETKEDDVMIWISIWALESFIKLIDPSIFNDGGGLDVRLTGRYIALFAGEICSFYGIKLENIFPKQ